MANLCGSAAVQHGRAVMRKLMLTVLTVTGLTSALLADPAWGRPVPINGTQLANGVAINGTPVGPGIDTTGLSLSGVILPAAAR
jgi:hypothetical protein